MAVTKTHPIKSTLKAAIDYILNPEKTDGKLLASSFGCGLETADIEFAWTREAAGDRGTHLGRHLIQSFAVGETTPEEAHKIGMELAGAVLGGKYEFVLTTHVETVVLLSKGEVDSKKIRVEFSLEDMDMSEFQDGATYTQIKDYVLEHSGLKVSNLYISQIKRKCGIEVGKNYNLPKSEDSRQPLCPPEKEKAIREAFKYFGII